MATNDSSRDLPTRVLTGGIVPRDYGLVVPTDEGQVFLSPLKYALGALLLERPSQIRRRLQERAERNDTPYDELEEAFVAGVLKREGTKNLLNFGGRAAVANVRPYANMVAAQVKAKARRASAFHTTQVSVLSGVSDIVVPRCDCGDSIWGEPKRIETVCVHAAALHTALASDARSGRSADENYTGLPPSMRPKLSLPFAFLQRDGLSPLRDQFLTEVLFAYFVDGQSQYSLDKELLAQPLVYTQALADRITAQRGQAQFRVMRQDEQRVVPATESQRRMLAANIALENRIVSGLQARGFNRAGYGLEFAATPSETVALRLRQGHQVYAICMSPDQPPLVVRKHLGGHTQYWRDAADSRADAPAQRIGEKYETVDDATRRDCLAEVVVPGAGDLASVPVPQILQERYAQMRK